MEKYKFSEPNEDDSVAERKERVLGVLSELLSGRNKDDELLQYWHKLLSQEAELIIELKQENKILAGLLNVGSIAQVVSDDKTSATNIDSDAKSAMLRGVAKARKSKGKKKRTRTRARKKSSKTNSKKK